MIEKFFAEESGQGMAEYALIVGLVGVALIAVLVKFKDSIKGVLNTTSDTLSTVSTGTP